MRTAMNNISTLVEVSKSALQRQLRRAVLATVVVGAAGVAFTVYKLTTAERRRREEELRSWLLAETDRLALKLSLDPREVEWLSSETRTAMSDIIKAMRKGTNARGVKRDRSEIDASRAFLNLKQAFFKKLKLESEEKLLAVHKFFDEFELRFINMPFRQVTNDKREEVALEEAPASC